MTTLVGLLLTLLALAFVAYPFFRQRVRLAASAVNERLRELHSRRDTSYSMLKELEFDYASGILTEEDYRDLEARYKRKAINVLKEMDGLDKGGSVGNEIERQVRQLRRKQKGTTTAEDERQKQVKRPPKRRDVDATAGDEIERQVSQLRQKGEVIIKAEDETETRGQDSPRAQETPEAPDGETLTAPVNFCRQCGARIREGDRFCFCCGTKLE